MMSPPEIQHPKFLPMRFYRVALIETNTSASNPTVSVISPTNGTSLSESVTFQISASSSDILSEIKLYIDGEEQWPSDDDSNFVINTCEWPNGNHIIFATAKSQSGLEGIPNSSAATYGRAVSSYVNVTFSNLISSFDFSQPFFEPALGQTQAVTATFAANCDWTLQIQDVNSNTVRTATGSGSSMEFDWDGTGDGGTNIPDGVYNYVISAQTNGESGDAMLSRGSSSFARSMAVPAESSEVWAVAPDSENVATLAIYPPGFDTNGFTIFSATPSEVASLTASSSRAESAVAMDSGGSSFAADDASPAYSGPSGQSTAGPTRKPKSGAKGTVGTFGVLYKTYSLYGFNSPHPATGWPPPLPTLVAIDGQGRTDQTQDKRILEFATIAKDFADGMKRAGWKQQFLKADNQWSATDIEKTSLGGNSIFNTCNFGLLMTHGSYGNSGSTGTEDDNIRYTYCWLGGNNYVRLSDMDFGSDGTNGLKWMTIYACNILKSANYNSMNSNFKIPVNENLHLLLGPSSFTYAFDGFGKHYAENLVYYTNSIINAFNNAAIYEANYHSSHVTNSITHAVSGWPACFNDSLLYYSDPDSEDGLSYQQYSIFNYSP